MYSIIKNIPYKNINKNIDIMINKMDLTHQKKQNYKTLSGGEVLLLLYYRKEN